MSPDMQRAVWRYIADHLKAYRLSPSYEEIAAGVGLAGRASVHRHIDALEKRGIIRRERRWGNRRNIRLLVAPPTDKPLPAVLHRRLADYCQKHQISRSTVVAAAIADYLDREAMRDAIGEPSPPAPSRPSGHDARAAP